MEQLCLDNDFFELNIDDLNDKIKEELEKENNYAVFGKLIYARQNKGYISIRFDSISVAKITSKKSTTIIEIKSKYDNLFDEYEIVKRKNDITFVSISEQKEVISLVPKFVFIAIDTYKVSNEFGCCSRFEQCSDAKKCLHPDKMFSMSCQYRKNLEAGKIFYGKNRNI